MHKGGGEYSEPKTVPIVMETSALKTTHVVNFGE